ncbi:MAG: competence/damage-inducible protein A [Levilactobacillus sp.]|jgi:nicotinamide-nucleotide amidase|uniref:Putative competence-damage inducible protein n=1 Tax=Levilactobacillus suantsaiihabitans TaxID=2487722 RepID=A0A4Z0J9C0_9LACO|nr:MULTISPECIES: competence/damage-inducible protein A [Levilactobacillus]MCH4124288.1 competence/damage-inducible protein A [Levilactobacillus sp.]MCI1554279.1 competence/damage-inducible protein A [Levilactobacillus sp.]MCI1599876.1 competence/damage-inducible protein A [Levilactobacillus sp.]MCI1606657.1 competence/damage-inducible protein A [Levilactobacillus sp.]TGD19255.1 competence/damage-inducible protein A [Levilactobacillus suantsaiihabitans]
MQAEIIAVGTEILLGQIVDTNSAFIAQELAQAGIEVYYHSLVGDNADRLTAVVNQARSRSDLVIISGGLGPTKDDLTKQTVAHLLGVKLVENAPAMAKIRQHFSTAERPMTPNNRLQALYPEGSQPLKNRTGMAVGAFYQDPNAADIMLLPGPPSEAEPMFAEQGVPLLKATYHRSEFLESRVLRFFGIGEGKLVTELADLIDQQTNPTIAPYAKVNEVTLRLTAQAHERATAVKLLDKMTATIQDRVGDYLYGFGDDNTLAAVVVNELIDRHLTITGAESLTAGKFQSTLGDVPGVSAIFPGGFVTYANSAKHDLLGIPQAIIDRDGVVSAATAQQMAERSRAILDTDFSLSFTGVAGPDSLEGHPAGTVWLGLAQRGHEPRARLVHLTGTRAAIRERSVMTGLDWLRRVLNGSK